MPDTDKEMDAREIQVLANSLSAALLASSLAVVIGFIAFALVGQFTEAWAKVLPIAALTFAGTYLGTAVGYGVLASRLRKRHGPLVVGHSSAPTGLHR